MAVTGYLAPENLENVLARELGGHASQFGRLFLDENQSLSSQVPLWVDQVWKGVEIISIASVNDAVKKLKERGKLWCNYSFDHHRRSQLIQEGLPKIKSKNLSLKQVINSNRNIGSWTLLTPNQLALSPVTSTPQFPLGQVHFEELTEPPSRAYLKLWEALTLQDLNIKSGMKVLDLGSSPGGWTWVLAQLGCQIWSVDRAELEPKLRTLENIQFLKKDAFSVNPEMIGKVDWLLSDIICYPEKLLQMIQRWKDSGMVENYFCTLKFQSETNFEVIQKFRNIPDSRLVHLYHNKHELSWILQKR